jgi:hypothetical protein
MTNRPNNHRDLDMSDVLADADSQFSNYLMTFYDMSPDELAYERYLWGPEARRGEEKGVEVLIALTDVRSWLDNPAGEVEGCGCEPGQVCALCYDWTPADYPTMGGI